MTNKINYIFTNNNKYFLNILFLFKFYKIVNNYLKFKLIYHRVCMLLIIVSSVWLF